MAKGYRQQFPNKHTFLPVIHVEGYAQLIRNINIAKDNGADGAFMISHTGRDVELLRFFDDCHIGFGGFWVGVNCLTLPPNETYMRIETRKCCGLWCDNVGVNEHGNVTDSAIALEVVREVDPIDILYFGGVAFKGQPEVEDEAAAAFHARMYTDVVTTSGSRTGSPPRVEKIRRMKEAIGEHPLAIASSMSPENVEEYLPYSDCFLVASAISRSGDFYNLDPKRVNDFAKAIGR